MLYFISKQKTKFEHRNMEEAIPAVPSRHTRSISKPRQHGNVQYGSLAHIFILWPAFRRSNDSISNLKSFRTGAKKKYPFTRMAPQCIRKSTLVESFIAPWSSLPNMSLHQSSWSQLHKCAEVHGTSQRSHTPQACLTTGSEALHALMAQFIACRSPADRSIFVLGVSVDQSNFPKMQGTFVCHLQRSGGKAHVVNCTEPIYSKIRKYREKIDHAYYIDLCM